MIGPISGSGSFGTYGVWGMGPGMSKGTDIGAETAAGAVGMTGAAGKAEDAKPIVNPGESTKVHPGKKVSPAECQTCKERKYQDGSDENVSFKSAQHISPTEAGARVRAHEQEHVANAYDKAKDGNTNLVYGAKLETEGILFEIDQRKIIEWLLKNKIIMNYMNFIKDV